MQMHTISISLASIFQCDFNISISFLLTINPIIFHSYLFVRIRIRCFHSFRQLQLHTFLHRNIDYNVHLFQTVRNKTALSQPAAPIVSKCHVNPYHTQHLPRLSVRLRFLPVYQQVNSLQLLRRTHEPSPLFYLCVSLVITSRPFMRVCTLTPSPKCEENPNRKNSPLPVSEGQPKSYLYHDIHSQDPHRSQPNQSMS